VTEETFFATIHIWFAQRVTVSHDTVTTQLVR